MFFKKYFWKLEKKSLFFLILFFTVFYSLEVFPSTTNKSLTTPPLPSPPLDRSWMQEIRQTKNPGDPLIQRFQKHHIIIKNLYGPELIEDLLWQRSEISTEKSQEEQNRQDEKVSDDFFNFLNEASPQQINDFINKNNFTQTFAILTVIFLINENRFGEDIFDLIKLLDLSVNDTLNFADLNSQANIHFHEGDINPDNVITTLSHQLAATRNLKIIQKLVKDKNYDPTIKNYLQENILHAFIRTNHWILPKTEYHPEHKEAFYTLARNSKKIINGKDALEYTPLALAVAKGNKPAVQVLMDKKTFSADLNTTNIWNQSLIGIAKVTKNENMLTYLNKQNSVWKPNKKKRQKIIFFNFEPMIKKMGISSNSIFKIT